MADIPRNILFIESGTSGGGSFVSLYHHLKSLRREQFRPVVVYLNRTHFVDKVKATAIPVYVFTDYLYSRHAPHFVRQLIARIASRMDRHLPGHYLKFARIIHKPLIRRLERLVKRHRIDLIHLNGQINRDIFGVVLAEKTGLPCISHLRSMRGRGFERNRASFANKTVSLYVANSRATKRYWERKGIDPSKTRVVYNTVDETPVDPIDIRKAWPMAEGVRTVFGCVGNFVSAKGHGFLLQAVSRLGKCRSDTMLLLVGDGPLRADLMHQTRQLGIADTVMFAGFQESAREIIAALDFLVVPSKSEGFGRAVIEAMQVKVPVVATTTGGMPEIIKNEQNGLLVPYGAERELANALMRLIADKQLRTELGQRGYETVRERFNRSRYALEFENIYEKVIGE